MFELGLVLAGSGHRPDKLGGYGDDVFARLVKLAEATILACQPEEIISGMALGWDMALAQAAINLNVPLTAAIPFKGQELKWPEKSQTMYHDILSQCPGTKVIVCSEGGYAPAKMQVRNVWMCNQADGLLALWNGSSGGTANCIHYATLQGVPVCNVWNSWEKFKGF